MGRSSKPTVSVLGPAFKQINKFVGKVDSDEDETHELEKNTFSYGLIVGQMPQGALDPANKKEDFSHPVSYVVYFARTPVEVKEPDDDDDEDGEDVEVEVNSLEQVDPGWIMEHAKQVSVMLPGGIRVLGVYFADEQSTDKVLNSKTVESCLQKIDSVANADKKQSSNYLTMHFDRKKGTYGCEVVTVSGGAVSKARKQVDVEEAETGFRWQVITSKFLFDYPIVFKAGSESERPVYEKVKLALKMVEANLATANVLLNNMFRSKQDEFLDEKLLVVESKSPRAKSKSKRDIEDIEDDDEDLDDARVKEYFAEILLDPEFQESPGDVEVLHVSSRMRLSGRMAIRAFLHPRATVAEAVNAVKTDLLKSLNARCEMHCDSLVGEEARGAGDEVPVLHEPPRRVLIKLPDSDVTISDFLFPGEATEASAKAVEEMFGFVPELEDLDDEQELVASPKQVTSGDEDEKIASALAALKTKSTPKSSPFSPLSIILSLAAAALGVVFSYLYSMSAAESDDDVDLEDLPPMPGERRIPRRDDF